MTLKSFFLPTEEVSASRRLKTFGTENKAVAGGVIIGGAVAGIAAGAYVGAVGAAAASKTAGKAVLSGAKSLIPATTKGKLKAVITYPIIAGVGSAVLKDKDTRQKTKEVAVQLPGQTFRASEGFTSGAIDIIGGDAQGGLNKIKQTFKDNPYGATLTTVVGGALVGGGIYYAAKTSSYLEQNKDLIDLNSKEYSDKLSKLTTSADVTTPPPAKIPTDKGNGIITTPPPSYVDTNTNKSQPTSAPVSTGSTSTSSGAPVNIQQNNYFGDKLSEKYINSKKNTV